MGYLQTNPKEIEKLALKMYKQRLKNKPIKDYLKNVKKIKEDLCNIRLEDAKRRKSPPWSINDLEDVLKYLKKIKSRDPIGLANELFQLDVAGNDLKIATHKLVNRINDEQNYPEAFKKCNISSNYKNKKSRNDFENFCGIFRVPI